MTPRSLPMSSIRRLALAAAPLVLSSVLGAQDLETRVQALERRNAELESRLGALADEQASFSLAGLLGSVPEKGLHGLGPSASKVYSAGQGHSPALSIGGYGESVYTRRNGGATDQWDALRTVLYVGYHFDEHWVFNSEIEFEHAGEEVGVEFATIDYLCCESFNARAGLVLIPMGFVNELHEPTAFLTAERSQTERRILPSTWRENGVGVFGDAGPVSYRAYVVNGLDATGFGASGLRGGRQNGSEALAEDLAFVGRVDWTDVPGLLAGVSAYLGAAGQDQAGLGSTTTTIAEVHAEWRSEGLWIRALAARAMVDDVTELNTALGLAGTDSVGEELQGAYVEVGYDVLGWLAPECDQELSPYVRLEAVDTQAEVPAGFASDPANDFDVLTLGLNWRPHRNLVFKLEFQDQEHAADGVDLALGFTF